jgi:hypothetical protein
LSSASNPRLGGACLVVGAVLLLTGYAIHPAGSETFDVNSYANATTQAVWVPAHAIEDISLVIAAFGFIQLYMFLKQHGEVAYSLAGLYCAILGTGVFVVDVTIHGFMGPVLAQDYLSATGTAQATAASLLRFYILLDLTLIIPWILLVFATITLFSASMLRTRVFKRPLAIAGMILGLALFVGYATGLFGLYFVLSSAFFPFSTIVISWLVALGIFFYRAKT